MTMARVVVVAGGIGSGKSVVCRILSAMGREVYDCDTRAKTLMDSSEDIKSQISARISADAVDADGGIDRKRLASVVFSDPSKLAILNGIVHGAVRDDVARRVSEMPEEEYLFVETAIPHASGLDVMADAIICVEAPLSVRVERVMLRSGLTEAQVVSRIDAQQGEAAAIDSNPDTIRILNDGKTPILPQLLGILDKLP